MATSPSHSLRGEFAGLSCRRSAQAVGSPEQGRVVASIAYNTDTSRGYLTGRPGYEIVADERSGVVQGMGAYQRQTAQPVLLVLYHYPTANVAKLRFYSEAGVELATAVELSDKGWVPHPRKPVQFVQFRGVMFFTARDEALWRVDATLEVTRIDAQYDTGASAFAYADIALPADALCTYLSIMVYGGVSPEIEVPHTGLSDAELEQLPPEMRDAGSSSLTYGADAVLFSDSLWPTGVKATAFTMVGTGGRVTALAPVANGVMAFTDSSMSLCVFGSPVLLTPTSVVQVSNTIGCVNPRSVVQFGGGIAWVGADGVYTWHGEGPQRISADIDDLWSLGGWREAPMLSTIGLNVGRAGWPWNIATSLLWRDAHGVYDHRRRLLLWTVPVDRVYDSNEQLQYVTLAYSVESQSWDLWGPTLNNGGFMPTAWAEMFVSGEPRLFFGNHVGQVCEFGITGYDWDTEDPSSKINIAWMWQSGWLSSGSETQLTVRSVSVVAESIGVPSSETQLVQVAVESDRSFNVPATPWPADTSAASGTPDAKEDVAPVFDERNWGSTVYGTRGEWLQRVELSNACTGSRVQVAVTRNSQDSDGVRVRELHVVSGQRGAGKV